MIKVYRRIGESKNPNGTDLPKLLITAEVQYGGGRNFGVALAHLMETNEELNSNLKDIIFDSYIQMHVIEDGNPISLFEWAKTAFPEEFV
jgi:hypothetical protein